VSSSFSLGSSHPTASPLNTASEEIVLVELDSPIHAAASVIREADSVHHLPPGPLLSQLPDPCKPRLCSLTTGYGQGDRLRLKLVLIEVVCSEYGNAALDHLSTLSQFPLLSPSVLRSPSLLLSIPPLRKWSLSVWFRLSFRLRRSCGKRTFGIITCNLSVNSESRIYFLSFILNPASPTKLMQFVLSPLVPIICGLCIEPRSIGTNGSFVFDN